MDERSPVDDNRQSNEERRMLYEIINNNMRQERSARRWKIFFRLAILAIIALALFLPRLPVPGPIADFAKTEEHTALVKLRGIILDGAPANANDVNTLLEEAFENEQAKGVILYINSPGGSPVQSAEINTKIRELKKTNPAKPIYAVVGDLCASGGYYVAVAADSIYANRSSLVGSIGVIYDGFGFVELIEKLGIERRVYTAGKNKDLFDPFSPEKPVHKKHLQGLLDELHRHFIATVKQGRKDKLKANDDIFSGLIWTGDEALRLGLIDEIGDMQKVADVIGNEKIVEYKKRLSLLDTLAYQTATVLKHFFLEQTLLNTPH